jgi:hypothetical protein
MTIPEILQSSIAGIVTESFFPVAQHPGFTHHAFVILCLWRKTEDRSVDKSEGMQKWIVLTGTANMTSRPPG